MKNCQQWGRNCLFQPTDSKLAVHDGCCLTKDDVTRRTSETLYFPIFFFQIQNKYLANTFVSFPSPMIAPDTLGVKTLLWADLSHSLEN